MLKKHIKKMAGVGCILIACYYSILLFQYYQEAYITQETFETIKEEHRTDKKDKKETEKLPLSSAYQKASRVPFIESLMNENEDIFGWIRVEGTQIDFPVMFTPQDPEYYINRDFYHKKTARGTPFLDGRFKDNHSNYIIYGHHMKDGSMFSDLLRYTDETFFKENRIIQWITLYEEREFHVIGAFYSELHMLRNDFPWYEYLEFEQQTELDSFIDQLQRVSLHKISTDVDFDVDFSDRFITLVTCSYHDDTGRFVVVGREKILNQ
ncbi:sortase B [Tindallia magadiensis]|uniref:Sortase B n=1 Tax=Tindallia magadiensis TaxID=69895 RepID=A0A1I3G6L8_9FIRM|nr:class B sortase [Tindallia magadiensis]SFI19145.1 sortase B [Tindallia magadiensis]